MQTWQNWAVFLAIAAAAYWYYTQSSNASDRGRSPVRTSAATDLKDSTLWIDSSKKPKANPKQSKSKAPRKTVKAAVQEVGVKVEAALAAASATSDADDDGSPVASPAKAPSGKDVSDMLGSQRAAPAVLTLKPGEKPVRPAKPQPHKTENTQESKKQRQNRKKVEEAKVAREEAEKQRQILLENQRRTAREARGEAAKNGLGHAMAPASNAWSTHGAVQPPSSGITYQPFDTFESASTGSASDAPTNGTAQTAASLNGVPTEEEQVRLAMADSAWTTVPKGGKKVRKTVNEEILEESSGFAGGQVSPPVKAVRPIQAMKPENQRASSRYQILSEEFTPSHKDDSDWPVV